MLTWQEFIKQEQVKGYYKQLEENVNVEYQNKKIFPLKEDIFKAFELTEYNQVKVVLVGQDPYHNDNQAMGLSFSVAITEKTPPSLKNIFKELENDLNIKRTNPDLSDWATQGVFLLNRTLTVEKNKPNSHANIGWEKFTNEVIKTLNKKTSPMVFILWGNNAQQLKELINNDKHLIITSSHPSPFSANKTFFGSKPFSKTNDFLVKNNIKPIIW